MRIFFLLSLTASAYEAFPGTALLGISYFSIYFSLMRILVTLLPLLFPFLRSAEFWIFGASSSLKLVTTFPGWWSSTVNGSIIGVECGKAGSVFRIFLPFGIVILSLLNIFVFVFKRISITLRCDLSSFIFFVFLIVFLAILFFVLDY